MQAIKFVIINKCILLFINFTIITLLAILLNLLDTRDKVTDA